MYPVLAQFELGSEILTFHAYRTFLALAAGAAGVLFVRGTAALGLGRSRAAALFVLAVAAGLVGARMLDAAMNLPAYVADPARLVSTEPSGFALFGGLGAAMAVALVSSRCAGIPMRRLADASIPAVAAGIVLLRIGCFLNGCCAGVATSLPWGVVFPPHAVGLERALLDGQLPLVGRLSAPQAVHPTQTYELIAAALLGSAARLWTRPGTAPGMPALVFAAGFLVFRALNQALRPPAADAVFSTPMLVAIYLGVGLAACALLARELASRARPGVRVTA